jgi:hypothetical protein
MDNQVFLQGLEDIYATHGKAIPGPKIGAAIYDRIRTLPDAFMTFAVDALRDYASLPSNMGREMIRVLWPAYRDKNPQLASRHEEQGCDACRNSRAGVGFLFSHAPWGHKWHIVMHKCVCNKQENIAHWEAKTPEQIRDAGYTLGLPGESVPHDTTATLQPQPQVTQAPRQGSFAGVM